MKMSGPIVIVEDDLDDQEILRDVFQELALAHPLRMFSRSLSALEYLKTTLEKPFLILSDINVPLMNGFEFKHALDSDKKLRDKSIPFIFFSTSAREEIVNEAYKKFTIQGFFQKPPRIKELKDIVLAILHYWKICKHPAD
jgi:CheY-like chemotaxis protein